MFCGKCGSQIPDGVKFCSKCGNPVGGQGGLNGQKIVNGVNSAFNNVEQQLGSAVNDVHQSFSNGGSSYNYSNGEPLKTDRGLLSYILLSIITCGIYGYYFIYKMALDVNTACEGDGESTGGLAKFIILSFLTCGIYAYVWYYKLGNRLAENAPRYGMNFQENGTTVIMWFIFGSCLCGVGPFIALNILIKNTNRICMAYNKAHGLM